VLVVDAANVIGSRPTGWWRDRAGAARRLHGAVAAAVADARLPGPVVLVLEGAGRSGVAAGDEAGVTTVHAPGSGDDEVVAQVRPGAIVVSADRALRARVEEHGGSVVGPGWLLERLDY